MKKIKCAVAFIFSLIVLKNSYGQDPAFSQFFSSPLNINPALTANINADWRFISNFRDQWIGPASPYVTGTASYDEKIMQNKIPGVIEEKNTLGVGAMMMFDYAMSGVVKSSYASLNLSYNVKLAEGAAIHRLGAGFGATYGNRNVNFDRVNFEEQFTGIGFNTNLPTGESALSEMKPYISVNAGLIYSITSEKSNIDFGVAAFHVNKPKQTFLEDKNQYLTMRKVVHANFETFVNDRLFLNINTIYQYQLEAKYYSFGAAMGHFMGNQENVIVNLGLWYWSDNAFIPYLGLVYNDFQLGFSYDYTISKLRQATKKPNSFEISFIIRGIKDPKKIIPCPWK